ncbi:MAG: ATP-binding protein [Bacillota bacterium]|nr:ATP-binding protein [Bacillota bacterium]
MDYYFNGCVRSDLKTIKDFVETRIQEMNRYILDSDKLFDIKLIVNELVINGALHGNKLSSDRSVYLKIDIKEDSMTIKVRDEGNGISYDVDKDYYPEDMLSTGRGLVLVNGLVDRVELDHNKVVAFISLKNNDPNEDE